MKREQKLSKNTKGLERGLKIWECAECLVEYWCLNLGGFI